MRFNRTVVEENGREVWSCEGSNVQDADLPALIPEQMVWPGTVWLHKPTGQMAVMTKDGRWVPCSGEQEPLDGGYGGPRGQVQLTVRVVPGTWKDMRGDEPSMTHGGTMRSPGGVFLCERCGAESMDREIFEETPCRRS